MHVKLLQTTFSDSHRPRRFIPHREHSFQSFSKFPNLSLFIVGAPLLSSPSLSRKQRLARDPVVAYATELSTSDRPHACAVPNQSSARKRQIGFESLLLFSMRRESIRITCAAGVKSFSLSSLTDVPSAFCNQWLSRSYGEFATFVGSPFISIISYIIFLFLFRILISGNT